jgi:membrane peptidoglycan carboxypeptidase
MKILNKTILLKLSLGSGAIGIFIALISFYIKVDINNLKYNLDQSTLILDNRGVLLDEIHGEEHRKIIPLKEIDKNIQQAVVAIEDKDFYKHNGISLKGIGRAALKNIQTRSTSEGASTITMQLAKNLSNNVEERNLSNKIEEAFYALKLEQSFSKKQILEMYLNTIYWGNNTYGIETATESYFNKTAKNVEVNEAAFLASIIQNPSRYNPYNNSKENYVLLKQRQKEVLKKIGGLYTNCYSNTSKYNTKDLRIKCIDTWAEQQNSLPLNFTGKTTWQKSKAGYATDAAVLEAIKILPDVKSVEDLEIKGYKIYTTIDNRTQQISEQSINGYKDYKNNAQFAFVAIEPSTNKVLAIVGGTDYNKSSLNRALGNSGLSGRQPGSSIKPYVYYEAMKHYNPEDMVIDEAYCVDMGTFNKPYCPKNYGGSFSGAASLKEHLAKSNNIPAVKVGQAVGIKNVIKTMKRLGITTQLDNIPSFPLGSNNLILTEHVNAFAAFANNGYQAPFTFIEKIENKEGKIVYQYKNKQTQKLDPVAIDKLNEMLNYTATNGTAKATNVLNEPVYAKTGTSENGTDVWCLAYTSNISTGLWIGHDDYNKKMYGATGGGWACPVTANILKQIK